VSKTLRTEQTGEMASKIAAIGVVRGALLKRQQDFAQNLTYCFTNLLT
jgi:cytidylate kinase